MYIYMCIYIYIYHVLLFPIFLYVMMEQVRRKRSGFLFNNPTLESGDKQTNAQGSAFLFLGLDAGF